MRKTILCSTLLLAGSILSAQIVINELIPPNTVEIKNIGGSTVNISTYTLCQFPNYNQLSFITQACGGDLMIEPGSLIAVTTFFTFNSSDGEMALYLTNGSFEDPGNITDYVEWGSHGHTRSSVAEAAGIWTNGDFVPSWSGCASLEYDGGGDASTDWISQDQATSPCMENSLDGCGGGACALAGAGLSGVACNNHGTPSDPNDDYITFNLDPSGVDLGESYNVSVSSGTVDPTNAQYGFPTAFQLQDGSAGAGNVTVTITDADDPSCTFNVLIVDPGSCSAACNLTDAGLSGIFCNDAGTPSDDSDDFIMFNLDPEGMNLGTSYQVSVSSGSVMPTSADYGTLTTFDLNNGSAGDGNVTVTLTDANDPSCTIQVVVSDPGTCSDDCEILDAGLSDVDCDDNGTTLDTDDFITFVLDPSGNNLDITYSVSVSSGSINPNSGSYGAPQFFSLNSGSAGGGNVTVTITDDADLSCSITVLVTDPGACSESCNLTSTGLSGVMCNDNGSPEDPSDDFISFSLNPSGANLGTTYSVSVSTGGITPTSGTYGTPTFFTMNTGSAGAGNVTVTVTDDVDPGCTESSVVTDPGTCSNGCVINDAGLSGIACHDGGTPADPTDDVIMFDLNPTGMNIGSQYSVSISAGTISPDTAAYGNTTGFTLNSGSAGGGNVVITLTDVGNPNCTLEVSITDPGSCSDDCQIQNAGLSALTCNDNGTPEDDTDDFIAFSLNPGGTNLSANYTVSVSMGDIAPDTAAYGVSTAFTLNTGSAGAGDITLTITDLADPACVLTVLVIDPGTCSGSCNITSAGLDNILCNDNATGSGSDDFISFTLNPGGTGLATNYNVSVGTGTINPATAPYGEATTFTLNPGSAGGGDVTVTITDAADPGCMFAVTITDPGACPCDVMAGSLVTSGETMICTDDGLTDTLVVLNEPLATGGNLSWIITDQNGVIQTLIPDTGDSGVFTFEGEPSGICLIWRISWEGALDGLMVGENLDSLEGCFDLTDSIFIMKLTGLECETSVYNPELAQLIRLYPVPVSGMLYIDAQGLNIRHIRIMDVIGRIVQNTRVENPSALDVRKLENGLYYVILETDRGWTLRRVAVSR